MKKEYVIGGLAILGAIALIAYLNKPKKNSEGFFNATGKSKSLASRCTVCDGGQSNYWAQGGRCKQGDDCVR